MKVKSVRCPQCGQPTSRNSEYFPFCSKRCRLLDLGNWLGGEYRVAGRKVDPETYRGESDEEK